MQDFVNRTGFTLQDMILECSYRGLDCKQDLFWDPIFTRYGKCYTFNSGKKIEPLKTLKGGIDNGLELTLDVQSDEYMPVWENIDEVATEMGFKVQIHQQNEPPLRCLAESHNSKIIFISREFYLFRSPTQIYFLQLRKRALPQAIKHKSSKIRE